MNQTEPSNPHHSNHPTKPNTSQKLSRLIKLRIPTNQALCHAARLTPESSTWLYISSAHFQCVVLKEFNLTLNSCCADNETTRYELQQEEWTLTQSWQKLGWTENLFIVEIY